MSPAPTDVYGSAQTCSSRKRSQPSDSRAVVLDEGRNTATAGGSAGSDGAGGSASGAASSAAGARSAPERPPATLKSSGLLQPETS